jgi:beta-glucosidase
MSKYSTRTAAVVSASVLVMTLGGPAWARRDRAERRCERVVAKAAITFLGAALAAPDDHQVATKTLSRAVDRACADDTVRAIAFGGECVGSDSVPALVRCLRGSHEAVANHLRAIIGTGSAADAKSVRTCRATVVRAAAAVLIRRVEAIHQCKVRPPRELSPGVECGAHLVVELGVVRRNDRFVPRIVRACSPDAVVAASFGVPCADRRDGNAIANCVLFEALEASDVASAAAHRDPGFCGDGAARVEERLDGLLADMTLEEKVSQMHGAVLQRGWRTAAIERLGIPGLGMLDGPRGVSAIAGGVGTSFPVGIARGATFDPDLEERIGEAIGREVRAKGADVVLAPVVNIVRHPRGGRTQESYGEDTTHLGIMGTAFVRGAQRHVIASVKHFAVNSIENTRFVLDVGVDERALREVYLPHFQRTIERGHAASVMSAYNKVNGSYCAENTHLLHDVLKEDWGFRGFVESDWIVGTHSTVPSLTAGLDIEMPSGVFYADPLIEAVETGVVPAAAVDAAVRRVLRTQLCFRLDTDPAVLDDTIPANAGHVSLARRVAEESLVLLKNDASTLPLDRTQLASLAVVGTLADVENLGDVGSSIVNPSAVVTLLVGIVGAAPAVTVTHVVGPPLDPADAAVVAAADAAIVVVGLTKDDEGEGFITHGDRDSLVLPRSQDDLVAATAVLNPRTIVVVEGSGPVLMPWLDDVGAVLMAWYPGQEGGAAIAEALFGDVVPSGKLPLSFPRAEADLPPFDPVSLSVAYDYWHGYRHLDRLGVTPLFPFGFGLSYTTFAFTNLTAAPATVQAGGHVRITVDVTNTGAVTGTEVAQLYVGYQGSAVERAPRDLKAFTRVGLAPGETQTLVFDLPTADLAYYDVAAKAWVIEPITYAAWVGNSSRATPLTASFAVTE